MRNRQSNPLFALLVLITILFFSGCKKEQPNILFIFADDQSYETIHSLGNDEIITPNLDRLVESGVTFTYAYNQGAWNGAVCLASRAMINTGRFLWHAWDEASSEKCIQWQEEGKMWAQLFEQAGYETYMTGKWHVGADPLKTFNVSTDIRGGMPKQTPEGYNRPVEGKPDPWDPSDKQFGGFWEGGIHWSEKLANTAVKFINQASGKRKPFFMYLAFNAAHDPRQSPAEYVEKYPLNKISLPVNYMDEYPFKDQIGCGKDLRDEKLAPFPRTPHAVKVNRREYYALITYMDEQIGRIIKALEESGEKKNTYIFFTADHGLSVGHHGLMGKQNMFDHSVRVPLMVIGPGIPENKRIDAPVYLQDVMPSSLDLAGLNIPDYIQFRSLIPLINGERSKNYNAIYGAYRDDQRMVTKDGFKLILYPKVPKTLLFNMKNDPLEQIDLSEMPEYQEKKKILLINLEELQKETGDTLDLKLYFTELQ